MQTYCIFCKGLADTTTVEHILPESLGGKEWACLPGGLVCASCNQYFGSKVEPLALGSFPFLPFRLLLGIPTKHAKPPKIETHLGTISASGIVGQFGIEPLTPGIGKAISERRITQVRILAEPTEPLAVCRLLLKMGLELVANDSHKVALSSKFDPARRFARAPALNSRWWFLLHLDHEPLFEKFLRGFTPSEWFEGVKLEVVDVENAEVFHLQLLDLDLITPLEDNVLPPPIEGLAEPEYRLFQVICC